MKKYLLSFILLISSLGYGEELALKKDEVLSRIDAGTLSFDKAFILPLTDKKGDKTVNINKDMLVAKLLKGNPTLKEEYLYYNYMRTNKWEYSINYEWYSRKCMLRISEFTRDGKTVNYVMSDMMLKGTDIPIKYCEKLYGMKIK